MYQFIPQIKIHSNQQPRWFTPEIRHHIKCLRTLCRKHKRHPTNHHSEAIYHSETILQAKISKANIDYESNLISNCAFNNTSTIYNYIKDLTKTKTIPSTITLDQTHVYNDIDKANLFNTYFHSVYTPSPVGAPNIDSLPSVSNTLSSISIDEADVYYALTSLDPNKAVGLDEIGPRVLRSCAAVLTRPFHHLFSISIRYAVIPDRWKIHKVIPVFKSGDRSSAKCYRPISLLSNTSKVLERLIYNEVISKITNFISNVQFGFLKNRSTLQQLLIFVNEIFTCGTQSDAVYFDIRKAFDSVCHNQLLVKLWSAGISGQLWSWFRSYLSDRSQFVVINNQPSSLLPVLSGVPQGSILGPLLFLIYINDIFHINIHHSLLTFTDDTKCFGPVTNCTDEQLLQHDIDLLLDWSSRSYLCFNPTKCVHISFRANRITSYHLNEQVIPKLNSHRDLGIIISENLSWRNHYTNILSKAYKTLSLLRRTFKSSHSPLIKTKLYMTLVRSILTYCSPVWWPYLLSDINNLERIQRRATKYILNDYTNDYKSRLMNLNILPLMYTYEIADILFLIKSIRNPTNSFNINNYITFYTGSS